MKVDRSVPDTRRDCHDGSDIHMKISLYSKKFTNKINTHIRQPLELAGIGESRADIFALEMLQLAVNVVSIA